MATVTTFEQLPLYQAGQADQFAPGTYVRSGHSVRQVVPRGDGTNTTVVVKGGKEMFPSVAPKSPRKSPRKAPDARRSVAGEHYAQFFSGHCKDLPQAACKKQPVCTWKGGKSQRCQRSSSKAGAASMRATNRGVAKAQKIFRAGKNAMPVATPTPVIPPVPITAPVAAPRRASARKAPDARRSVAGEHYAQFFSGHCKDLPQAACKKQPVCVWKGGKSQRCQRSASKAGAASMRATNRGISKAQKLFRTRGAPARDYMAQLGM